MNERPRALLSRWRARARASSIAFPLAAMLPACPYTRARVEADERGQGHASLRTIDVDVAKMRAALWPRPGPSRYRTATQAEARAFTELLARTAKITRLDEIPTLDAHAAAAGFVAHGWRFAGEAMVALVERGPDFRGAGAYVFRLDHPAETTNATPRVLVQAPHAFHDVGTGDLALHMFLAAVEGKRPRALFVNTLHRYVDEAGQKGKQEFNPADVCHNPEHEFSWATETLARLEPAVRVIQLHGFADGSLRPTSAHATGDGTAATGDRFVGDAVISAGDEAGSSSISDAVAKSLSGGLAIAALRFPEDTRQLGATTNVQARLLQRLGARAFVHVELSSRLRKRLRQDADSRTQFNTLVLQAMVGAIARSPSDSG